MRRGKYVMEGKFTLARESSGAIGLPERRCTGLRTLEQSFVLLCGYATALEGACGAVPMLNLASPFHRNVLRGCANHG